ncbi:MAG: GGDEF domain-containing protein [Polyangiaceae bacterium]
MASAWSQRAGASVGAIGCLALIGWQTGIVELKSVVPGLVPMNPLTALTFMCLGTALVVRRALLTWVVAGVCIVIGVARLLDATRVIDLPFDRVLHASVLGTNRIAPNTALELVLIGTACALLGCRGPVARRTGDALASICALVGMLAIFGYAYGARPLYGLGEWIPMAANTAAAFVLASAGVISAAQGPLAELLGGEALGSQVLRRLLPTVVVTGWLAGWLRLEGQRRGLFSVEVGVAVMATTSIGLTVVFVMRAATSLNRLHAQLLQSNAALAQLATVDTLTGLPNRRLFEARLAEEVSRSRRHGRPLSLAVIDLDHFKGINDARGHDAGDAVLRRVGEVLRRELRTNDLPARLGGEELTILMPETAMRGACVVAERVCRAIAAESFLDAVGGGRYHATCSIGVAALDPEHDDAAVLLSRADRAMYAAKATGRNRVVGGSPADGCSKPSGARATG